MTIFREHAAPVAFCAALLALPLVASAGTVSIGVVDGLIVVEATEISSEEVLAKLGAQYGFNIERIGVLGPRTAVWGQFSGRLPDVIGNALENKSHMIVYSPQASHGIEKVVVYGTNCQIPGAAAQPVATPVPAQSSPQPKPLSPQVQTRSGLGRALGLVAPKPLAKEVIAPQVTLAR